MRNGVRRGWHPCAITLEMYFIAGSLWLRSEVADLKIGPRVCLCGINTTLRRCQDSVLLVRSGSCENQEALCSGLAYFTREWKSGPYCWLRKAMGAVRS